MTGKHSGVCADVWDAAGLGVRLTVECMWESGTLRDQNKAREHDRKSLNTRPLKNAGAASMQKQVT